MIAINTTSSSPIYAQIVAGVKEGVLKGVFEPGEKLPSVRELAKTLTLNPNTIQKAYRELERDKVVVVVQGRGTFISEEYRPYKDQDKLHQLKEAFKKEIIEAYYMGLGRQELLALIENIIDELEGVDRDD